MRQRVGRPGAHGLERGLELRVGLGRGAAARVGQARAHAGVLPGRGTAWQAATCLPAGRSGPRRRSARRCRAAPPRRRRRAGSAGGSGSRAGCAWVGRLAGEDLRLHVPGLGHDGEQRARVRVLRRAEHLLRRARSTIRPRYMTAIRSAMFQASPRSCVTTRIVTPVSCTSRCISARISPRTEASRLETGSSATSSDGSSTIAPAMTTRWRCPPGELVRVAGEEALRRPQPERRARAATRASSPSPRPWMRSPSATAS